MASIISGSDNFNTNDNATQTELDVVEFQLLGVGQTWQNLTASRSAGVTYTNDTGKPIHVKANGTVTYEGNMWGWSIDGELATYASTSTNGAYNNYAEVIVPNGATYRCTPVSIFSWFELR